MSEIFIGLMSGTSLDGVDGVLVDCSSGTPRHLADAHQTFDSALREELLALNTPGTNELARAALAGNALAEMYAATVQAVLARVPRVPTRRWAIDPMTRRRPWTGRRTTGTASA